MAAYQMFDMQSQSISTETFPTLFSTADGERVHLQVDLYSNRDGSVTSLIRTLIGGRLSFNRKPVTYSTFEEASAKLAARLNRTMASMATKAAKHGGRFPTLGR